MLVMLGVGVVLLILWELLRGQPPLPKVFRVSWYGADPTGATDSTAAFDKAIHEAMVASGGIVHVPEGEYRRRRGE